MTRMTHVGLHVAAIEDCIAFYARYCGMKVIDDQERDGRRNVLMAEPGEERHFVFHLMAGGEDLPPHPDSDRHFGFAVESREAVDEACRKGKEDGILIWPPEDGPLPHGYFCAVKDPNGNTVEFSHGHLVTWDL